MGSGRYNIDGKNKRDNVPSYLKDKIKEIDSGEPKKKIEVGVFDEAIVSIEIPKEVIEKKEEKVIEEPKVEVEDNNVLDLDNLRKMKKADLIEVAQSMGLEYKGLNKESLITRIDDYINS